VAVDFGFPHQRTGGGGNGVDIGIAVTEEQQRVAGNLRQRRRCTHAGIGLECPVDARGINVERIHLATVYSDIDYVAMHYRIANDG